MSEHIGLFPAILIAPDDNELIKGGSENRRKFVDSLLAQMDQQYLEELLSYTLLLKNRNQLLKIALESGRLDRNLLEIYDEQMIPLAKALHRKRTEFNNTFTPLLQQHYAYLASSSEEVGISFDSDMVEHDIEKWMTTNRRKDQQSGRTNAGPHKDDWAFTIDGHSLKKIGSQGQQKSFLIALKLAQYELLKANKQLKPLLLLDDIFDKLDDQRIQKLLNLIAEQTFGQIFITDARPERSKELLLNVAANTQFISITS
jgi:DNA replication and repair protein RecF